MNKGIKAGGEKLEQFILVWFLVGLLCVLYGIIHDIAIHEFVFNTKCFVTMLIMIFFGFISVAILVKLTLDDHRDSRKKMDK